MHAPSIVRLNEVPIIRWLINAWVTAKHASASKMIEKDFAIVQLIISFIINDESTNREDFYFQKVMFCDWPFWFLAPLCEP